MRERIGGWEGDVAEQHLEIGMMPDRLPAGISFQRGTFAVPAFDFAPEQRDGLISARLAPKPILAGGRERLWARDLGGQSVRESKLIEVVGEEARYWFQQGAGAFGRRQGFMSRSHHRTDAGDAIVDGRQRAANCRMDGSYSASFPSLARACS